MTTRNESEYLPPAYFRAGVGAVIVDTRGRVLACERTDVKGAWQFPQGGLERGEEPVQAVLREMREEIGVLENELQLLASYPEPLVYVLPPENRSVKTGWGQVQWWFLFRCARHVITLPSLAEFRRTEWKIFSDVLQHAVPFRKTMYERLQLFFAPQAGFATRP